MSDFGDEIRRLVAGLPEMRRALDSAAADMDKRLAAVVESIDTIISKLHQIHRSALENGLVEAASDAMAALELAKEIQSLMRKGWEVELERVLKLHTQLVEKVKELDAKVPK